MSEAQDRAEAYIRREIMVENVCILPEWPDYARRIVAALEGADRLSWAALRGVFAENEYDGAFGADYVVRHLVDGGVVARFR